MAYVAAIDGYYCDACQDIITVEVKQYELYPVYRYKTEKNSEDKTTNTMAAI
ncbi:hypothetical protein Csac_2101 [Caldicellulosiruptor saccharolyticus DSM 8903]|uniref:Uncharacterized protein n=1 Tax=Caldicellulosiruptor saccharolyticus (strain ATCC 43494 / DSM 8903 / Tp8T 6331) TaxID=351627 RepID=A4XL99_CALS8|nr:hypothetical protein [Caldicellulosiruptor saccharolyticus]ABP67684.2 hypothetical protein Csac_2101 [Caldicellulosiruptor saccharolyticus DSM 8903]